MAENLPFWAAVIPCRIRIADVAAAVNASIIANNVQIDEGLVHRLRGQPRGGHR